MRGLTVIVATGEPERYQAALTLACANAALGGRTRLYFNESAVRLLADPAPLTAARELDVRLIACQTGLADAGLSLPEGLEAGGMVSLLATLEDDRLVVA